MDLLQELWRVNDLLTKALEQYKSRGLEYAKAYATYRKLVAQELLKLKAEGMPVTIAYDIARGKEEVATAKEQEIIAECMYKSCQETYEKVYKTCRGMCVLCGSMNWLELHHVMR